MNKKSIFETDNIDFEFLIYIRKLFCRRYGFSPHSITMNSLTARTVGFTYNPDGREIFGLHLSIDDKKNDICITMSGQNKLINICYTNEFATKFFESRSV